MVGLLLPLLGEGWPAGLWARLSVVPLLVLLLADGSVCWWARLLVGPLLLRLRRMPMAASQRAAATRSTSR